MKCSFIFYKKIINKIIIKIYQYIKWIFMQANYIYNFIIINFFFWKMSRFVY